MAKTKSAENEPEVLEEVEVDTDIEEIKEEATDLTIDPNMPEDKREESLKRTLEKALKDDNYEALNSLKHWINHWGFDYDEMIKQIKVEAADQGQKVLTPEQRAKLREQSKVLKEEVEYMSPIADLDGHEGLKAAMDFIKDELCENVHEEDVPKATKLLKSQKGLIDFKEFIQLIVAKISDTNKTREDIEKQLDDGQTEMDFSDPANPKIVTPEEDYEEISANAEADVAE